MGNIKVKGKMQRVAIINDNRVVARAVRYSTVKKDELVSFGLAAARFFYAKTFVLFVILLTPLKFNLKITFK